MLPICYQNKSVQDEDGSYYNGTLDMSKEGDRMFKEFMDNGGPTGFVTNQNLDKYKKELYRGVRRKDGNMVAKAFTKLIADPLEMTVSCIEELNSRVENLTRFAAYQTSRQGGRSVLQSIHDAKEVSVNFGTRGAGGNTSGVAGMTAAWGRHTFYFYNAGVQGLEMYARNIRKHPIKGVGTMMLKPFMAGAAVALWNMLNGSDGEDGQLYRAFYNDLKAIESVERKVKKAAEGEAKRNAQQKLNEMRRELLKKIDSKRRELRK